MNQPNYAHISAINYNCSDNIYSLIARELRVCNKKVSIISDLS